MTSPVQEGTKHGRDRFITTRGHMSFREKGRLALLLLHHRPLRVCSVVAPSHPALLAKTGAILFLKRALPKKVGENCRDLLLGIGFALCVIGSEVSAAQPAEANFKPLDLSPFANFPRPNAVPELVEFPSGQQRLAGVPFVLGGRVAVTGMDAARAGDFLPPQISGIAAGQRAGRVHLLAGAIHGTKDGTPLGNLVFHYKDGSTGRARIIFGVHARNAIEEGAVSDKALGDPNSNIGWQKEFKGATNVLARIYHIILENPQPGQEITTLDFESLVSRATPLLFAITLETGEAVGPLATIPKRKFVQRGKQFEDSVYRHPLTLRVMGNSPGKPLSEAIATVMIQDDARTFFFGKYRADASGRIQFSFPPQYAVALSIRVSSPGLAPESLLFSSKDSGKWPEAIDVSLQSGDPIGGVVLNGAGKPVPGATIIPYEVRQTGPNE